MALDLETGVHIAAFAVAFLGMYIGLLRDSL